MINTPMFDTVRYYAFILDAQSRFNSEGQKLELSAWRKLVGQQSRKPTRQILTGVEHRMAQLGLVKQRSNILEFGVFKGYSIRILSGLFPKSRLYGFDTFSGLPDDGRKDWNVDFRVSKVPDAPANVEFVVGRFEDTLEDFLQHTDVDPIQLIHVDCDIFSSTHCVLRSLGNKIVPGTVIIFDELLNYDEFAENEMLAFYLFLEHCKLDFEWFVTMGDVLPFQLSHRSDEYKGGFKSYRSKGYYQNTSVVIKSDEGRDARIQKFMPEAYELAAQGPNR